MSWSPGKIPVPRVRAVLAAVLAVLLPASGTAYAADPVPQSHIDTPTTNGRVEVGEPVLVMGGGYVGYSYTTLTEYQVSVDGGATWSDGYKTGTTWYGGETGIIQALWSYAFTPEEAGVYTIVSRVNTDTEYGAVSAPTTLYVGVNPPAPAWVRCYSCGFYTPNAAYETSESFPLELGLRFRVDRPLRVGAIGTSWQGRNASRVRLWRGDGTLLADQTITSEYGNPLATPVDVVPGQDYVASFTSRIGHYRVTEDVFPATVIQAPLVLPAHAGVYSTTGGFPTETWHDSHYWVSPEFVTSAG
ncbi:DUF4082 domain-containing protein [Actinosynnema sp. NPDC020468]|uniref:DUF4082 domain-containing protein n=1 Tax=Actinosynnema sp. NPDC020468 TaxID=3154488 RepID=UPI0033D8F63E